jgi:hypothetical protein
VYYCGPYKLVSQGVCGVSLPWGLGEQMNRRCGSEQLPRTTGGRKRLAAFARPAAVGTVVVAGLVISGPVPARANAPPRPKPQVLWHAYPLDSTHSAPTGNGRAVEPRVTPTTPASAPARNSDAASPAVGASSTARIAAFGALAAAVVCALMLLRRRRTRARRRASLHPAAGESTGGRGLFHALSQEDGSLAPARRTDRRSTAPPGGRSSAVVAGEGVTGTLLERVGVVAPVREVRAERVERRPAQIGEQPGRSEGEKAALKRTGKKVDAAAVAKLKQKGEASASLKDARERDLTQLKAKLGEPQTKTKRPPAEKRAPAAAKPKPANRPPIASTEDATVAQAAPQPPTATAPSLCRIEWRRNEEESRFCAIARSPTGEESVLLSSPSFEWNEATPPPKDFAHAGSAYLALVSQLAADRWVATDLGKDWYALELKRTPEDFRSTNGEEGRT